MVQALSSQTDFQMAKGNPNTAQGTFARALDGSYPVIINFSPEVIQSIGDLFPNAKVSKNAPMSSIAAFKKSRHKNRYTSGFKGYGVIDVRNLKELCDALNKALDARSDITIGYEGYHTGLHNFDKRVSGGAHGYDDLEKCLRDPNRRAGDVLYADERRVIGFPRMIKSEGAVKVAIPYVETGHEGLLWKPIPALTPTPAQLGLSLDTPQ